MTRRSSATASRGSDTLRLKSVGEGIDFERKLANGIVAIGAARAEGVVLFAKSGHNVGEGLDGADRFFDKGGENQQENEQKDAQGGEHGPEGDMKQGEEDGQRVP